MKPLFLNILTLLILTAANAQAATYYVATSGNDITGNGTQATPFRTIQKGLDAAQTGDTVLVANGIYTGDGNKNLSFGGRNFLLKSQGGAANCIVNCEQSGRGFRFLSGETAQAVVEGFTIQNGKVTDTAGGGSGGAIAIQNSSPTIRACVLTGNTATHSNGQALGGGIAVQSGSPTLENCTFSNNTVQATTIAGGGGLAIFTNSSPTVINCTFTRNMVNSSDNSGPLGGGIYISTSAPSVISCTFSNNTANIGGGMAAEDSSPRVISCTFNDNLGIALGGGLYNQQSDTFLSQCTFSGNVSGFSGGGVSNMLSEATITHCTFTRNISTDVLSGGGGIDNNKSDATITYCTFTENSAFRVGGGMSNIDSNPTVLKCTFKRNLCYLNGGGMFNFQSNPTLTNCEFLGNTAGRPLSQPSGGGMYNDSSSPILRNCLFVGNSALIKGGGMSNYASHPVVTNCNFLKNVSFFVGGIYQGNDSTLSVWNSILFWNEGGDMNGGGAKFCQITGIETDSNFNSGADPMFVRDPSPGPDDKWGTTDDDYGDPHLRDGSPCYNSGWTFAPNMPPYDIDGDARFQMLFGPDRGVDEYGTTAAFNFYVDKATGSDTTGNGTPSAPFQTVTKALSVDPIGTRVLHIKAGNYDSDRPMITGRVQIVNWGNTGEASIGKQ